MPLFLGRTRQPSYFLCFEMNPSLVLRAQLCTQHTQPVRLVGSGLGAAPSPIVVGRSLAERMDRDETPLNVVEGNSGFFK